MDCFSHFSKVFCRNIKAKKQYENLNVLLVGFTTFLSLRAFLSGIEMGVKNLHLVIAQSTRLKLYLSCNLQNKFLLGALCH